jgi:excisionase family DNA binding protein
MSRDVRGVTGLTSADVAEILRVSPATVKRWADAGLLRASRTSGGHRRFTREEVERFRREEDAAPASGRSILDRFLTAESTLELQGALLTLRARLRGWWDVCDAIAPALGELLASVESAALPRAHALAVADRLTRALRACADALPRRHGAPSALLVAAPGAATWGWSSLYELCLAEGGWRVRFGDEASADDVARALDRTPEDAVLAVAHAGATAPTLRALAAELADVCASRQVELLLGGPGDWPGGRARRAQRFEEVRDWMAEVEPGGPALGAEP